MVTEEVAMGTEAPPSLCHVQAYNVCLPARSHGLRPLTALTCRGFQDLDTHKVNVCEGLCLQIPSCWGPPSAVMMPG